MMMKRALSPEEVTVKGRGRDQNRETEGRNLLLLSSAVLIILAKKVYEHHHHRQLPAVEMTF